MSDIHPSDFAFDPSDPAFVANPYPNLLALQKSEPAHWNPHLKAWILTRYEDVQRALSSADMSVDRIRPYYEALPAKKQSSLFDIVRYLNLWLVFRDPPEHTRLRNLMAHAFRLKAVVDMRSSINALADQLLDDLPSGEFDFVSAFAMQLPALVIMDLLGVPRDQMKAMKGWSDQMQLFIGSAQNVSDRNEHASEGARNMAALFADLIAERRAAPKQDLISSFIAARDIDDAFSEEEIIAASMLVLFGGHETTTNLLTTGLLKFIRYPQASQILRDEPDLIPQAVEECLRLDGPAGSMARVVASDHSLHGKTLREGERVFAMINAANQDPRKFERPDVFDITRSRNRHLTFG